MFKRLFWLMVGAGFGFGVSFWVMRSVRHTVERYKPERVTDEVTTVLRSLSQDLRSAAANGVLAMREREEELRTSR